MKDYKVVYLINTRSIWCIKIPVRYLKENNLSIPNETHLIHEFDDSLVVMDFFNQSVWIPKDIVEIEPGQ